MRATQPLPRLPVPRFEPVAVRFRLSVGGVLGWVAIALYVVSFFLPAYNGIPGFGAFLWSLIIPFFWPMWAANPLFWLGLSGLRARHGSVMVIGLIALLLALSEAVLFADRLGAGYFLWVGSMAVLAAAGFVTWLESWPRDWPDRPVRLIVGEARRIAARLR
jgi:hypothetical protein